MPLQSSQHPNTQGGQPGPLAAMFTKTLSTLAGLAAYMEPEAPAMADFFVATAGFVVTFQVIFGGFFGDRLRPTITVVNEIAPRLDPRLYMHLFDLFEKLLKDPNTLERSDFAYIFIVILAGGSILQILYYTLRFIFKIFLFLWRLWRQSEAVRARDMIFLSLLKLNSRQILRPYVPRFNLDAAKDAEAAGPNKLASVGSLDPEEKHTEEHATDDETETLVASTSSADSGRELALAATSLGPPTHTASAVVLYGFLAAQSAHTLEAPSAPDPQLSGQDE